ncbi:unnamed protein product [Amoebophrya sp. A120]|nr:unnamed protein product [Amoebophrya sp. A120]|eukprot:GSA120T00010200001.1
MAEEEEPPAADENVIPETGLVLTYTEEWVSEWNKSPSEASILELKQLNALQFRDEILCDFAFYNLMHCRSIVLNTKGTAIFCTLLESCALSITERDTTFDLLFKRFSDGIKAHKHAGYFSPAECKLMVDYAVGTFFKHFVLYRMCLDFVQKPARRFMCEVALEEPSFPPPTLVGAENITEKEKALQEQQAAENAGAAGEAGSTGPPEGQTGDQGAPVEDDEPIPPELQKILDLEVTASETRIREKLTMLHEKTNK